MASGSSTIKQRIAIEGDAEIKQKLKEVGAEGEAMAQQLDAALNKDLSLEKISATVDKLTVGLKGAGTATKDIGASGAGIVTIAHNFERFKGVVDGAAAGSKVLGDAFKKLGVELNDQNGNLKPYAQLLAEAAAGYAKLTDSTAKTTLGVRVFGRELTGVKPLFLEGSTGAQAMGAAIGGIAPPAEGAGLALTGMALVLGGIVTVIGGLVVAAGAAAGAMFKIASSAAETATKIRDGANAMGVSTDKYQQLSALAGKLNVSQDALGGALEKVDGALEKHKASLDKTTTAMSAADKIAQSLGINVVRGTKDLTGATADLSGAGVNVVRFGEKTSAATKKAKEATDEYFQTLQRLLGADGIKKFELLTDPIEKIKLLNDAFSKLSAQDQLDIAKKLGISAALPGLQAGKTVVEELTRVIKEQARELSTTELKALDDFTKAQTNAGAAAGSLKDKLGAAFAPAFTPILNEIAAAIDRNRDSMVAWGEAAGSAIPAIEQGLKDIVTFTGDAVRGLSDAGTAAEDFFTKLQKGDAKGAFGGLVDGIQKDFDEIPERWQRTLDTLSKMEAFKDLKYIRERFAGEFQAVIDDWNKGIDAWKDLGQKAGKLFSDAFAGAISFGQSIKDNVQSHVDDAVKALQGAKQNFEKFWSELGVGSAQAAEKVGSQLGEIPKDADKAATDAGSQLKDIGKDADISPLLAKAQKVFDDLVGAARKTGDDINTAITAAFANLGASIDTVIQAISAKLDALAARLAALKEAATAVQAPATADPAAAPVAGAPASGDPLAGLQSQAQTAIDGIRASLQQFVAEIPGLFAGITVDWSVLATGLSGALDEAKAKAQAAAQEIGQTLAGVAVDWSKLSDGLQQALDSIAQAVATMVETVKGKLAEVSTATLQIGTDATSAASQVQAATQSMVAAWNAVAQAAREAAAAQSGASSSGGGGDGFAAGGLIRGPGTATSDTVPIWASPGEYMQRAKAVQFWGRPLMEALNRLDLKAVKQLLDRKGFKRGGFIGSTARPSVKYGLAAFSGGGLVDGIAAAMANLVPASLRVPAASDLPDAAGSSRQLAPVVVNIGGQSIPMAAPEESIRLLQQAAARSLLASGGESPGWVR